MKLIRKFGSYLNGQKKVNCPEDAVKIFSQITEATLKSTVGLALSYSKCEQYQESYSVYSSALEWLTATDKEKAEILVAMSSMVYSFQGEEDTKTILYQCMSLENRPIQALANFLVNNFSKTTKYAKGACQIAQSIINLGHRSSTRYNSLDYATCLLTASEAIKNVDKVKQRKLIQQRF